MSKQKPERTLSGEIAREIWGHVDDLIESLYASDDIHKGPYGKALDRLIEGQIDYKRAACECEWLQFVVDEEGEDWALADYDTVPASIYREDLEKLPDAVKIDGDWADLCRGFGIDTDDHRTKPVSFWAVSYWLGQQLAKRGEIVEEVHDLTVWVRAVGSRTVLNEIAEEELGI